MDAKTLRPKKKTSNSIHARLYCFAALCFTCCTGCQPNCSKIEPKICYVPQSRQIKCLPSPFDMLSKEELRQEWGKELYVALVFANDMDLYRAITSFKRALIFLPPNQKERKLQIQYNIFQSYYWGGKYADALDTYDNSELNTVSDTFPAFRELLIMLVDCYQKTCQYDKSERIMKLIQQYYPETAEELLLSFAMQNAKLECIGEIAPGNPKAELVDAFFNAYLCESKSVQKARNLNAILPGAGYYYVGQKKAAVTSFVINALFTGAAYYFFKNKNIPAGLITASLEAGWYVGGINGAGLAAQEYNRRLYEVNGKEVMVQTGLFPVLMLQKSF